MKTKILLMLFAASQLTAIAAAHEEENPPLLQGFVHWLGLSEDMFVLGGTAVILFLVWLWKKID